MASQLARRRLPLLITPSEASSMASKSAPRLRFLDCSWHMPNSNRNAGLEYRAGPRIPGARFFDIDAVSTVPYVVPGRKEAAGPSGSVALPHMLPSRDRFVAGLAASGVELEGGDHVIAYDSVGCFSSPRLAWQFEALGLGAKVSVLNGGLPRWIAEGLDVETGERDLATIPFAAEDGSPEGNAAVVNFEEILSNAPQEGAVILDARSKERFDGTAPEPRPGLSSGHMPHSLSLPFSSLLSRSSSDPAYTALLPPAELERVLLSTLGGDGRALAEVRAGRRAVWTTCGSGMTAAIIWLALKQLGVDGARLYDESWTGYASRPDSIIIKSSA